MDSTDIRKLKLQLTDLIKTVDRETAAELEALAEKLSDLEALTMESFHAIAVRIADLEAKPARTVVRGGGGGPGPMGPQGPAGPPGEAATPSWSYFPQGF